MKKRLKAVSIIFMTIPFGLIAYLLYYLFRHENVNLLNDGIVLNIVENSFTLHFGEKVIFGYMGIYLVIISIIYIFSKIEDTRKSKGRNITTG